MILESKELAMKMVDILNSKKAYNINVLEVNSISSLADYFIICSGNSTIQTKAISDELDEKLSELGYEYLHKEGYSAANWVLLDYGEIVVHIFHHETRDFYNLERLWSDAESIDISKIIDECKVANDEGDNT